MAIPSASWPLIAATTAVSLSTSSPNLSRITPAAFPIFVPRFTTSCASCAIPAFYEPVAIGARLYIDGGVHSHSNLDLLTGRGLDAVIALKPDYTEGWNRRATLYYMKKDFGHALADIHEVLVLEPRHFGALSGLGLILQEIGDEKHALAAYRRALAIDPHLEHIGDVVNSLREKVEGRDI